MTHYPEQRFLSKLAVIRRSVMLPDNIVGLIDVAVDKRVDMREVVAYGAKPSHHLIVDLVQTFGLRKAEQAETLLRVKVGDNVDEITVLASKGRREVHAPIEGRVVNISDGRIIIEVTPEVIKLEAGVRGRVVTVHKGRGVTIETVGGQIQGAWGNNRRSIGVVRFEPEDGGLARLTDQFEVTYMGAIVMLKTPITEETFALVEEMNLAGMIAPSMHYRLRERALTYPKPVMLTEGFGTLSMNHTLLTMLSDIEGQQITLDAFEPRAGDTRRPEIIVTVQPKPGDTPSRMNIMLTFKTGALVRITRAPYEAQSGHIVDLPKAPIVLDNGLRTACARVELAGGQQVIIPLSNLEVIAR